MIKNPMGYVPQAQPGIPVNPRPMPTPAQQAPVPQQAMVSEGTKRPPMPAMPMQAQMQMQPRSNMPRAPAPMPMAPQMRPMPPRPVPNLNRPMPPMQGPVPMYPSSPLAPPLMPMGGYGGPMLGMGGVAGGIMSDANVKRDVHAAGYEAGIRDAMARLKSGNGTASQRNSDIDAALNESMRAQEGRIPPSMHQELLGSGNGTTSQRNAAIDSEIARLSNMRGAEGRVPPSMMREMAGPFGGVRDKHIQPQRGPMLNMAVPGSDRMPPSASVSPAAWGRAQMATKPESRPGMHWERDTDGVAREYSNSPAGGPDPDTLPVTPGDWDRIQNLRAGNGSGRDIDAEISRMTDQLPSGLPRRRDPAVMEPIEDIHRAPYADYNEDADKNLGWTKDRNADYGLTKENWPASDETRQALADRADRLGGFGPDRLYSDENLKVVDPVLKQRYVNPYGEGRAKMKNEGEHGPEKDPGKFPMQPRALGVVSDKGAKRVEKNDEADGFLESLKPVSYSYKDPANAPTSYPTHERFLGTLAQDISKGPTGNTLVTDTPRGKMLEGGALMSAMSAGLGQLHRRVKDLEGKKSK